MANETGILRFFQDARIKGGHIDTVFRNRHANNEGEQFSRWFEQAVFRFRGNTDASAGAGKRVSADTSVAMSPALSMERSPSAFGAEARRETYCSVCPESKTMAWLAPLDSATRTEQNKKQDVQVLQTDQTKFDRPGSTGMSKTWSPDSVYRIMETMEAYRIRPLHVTCSADGVRIWLCDRELGGAMLEKVIAEFRRVFQARGVRLAEICVNGKVVYRASLRPMEHQDITANQRLNKVY